MACTMLHYICIMLITVTISAEKNKEQTRWSRQISSYTADISDWVPLPGPVEREVSKLSKELPKHAPQTPIKRQAVAEPRILTEPLPGFNKPTGFGLEAFPPRAFFQSPPNRQLYLQSVPAVPSAPQNFLTDQGFGQSIRFGLAQPNFPLNQGFVAPQFPFEAIPQIKPRPQPPQPLPPNLVKFENFAKTNLPLSAQAKPFNPLQNKYDAPKFVDGYRAENASRDLTFTANKKPQNLQNIKLDNVEKFPKMEVSLSNKPKIEREEVQLLYVPVESLNRGQFNFRSPLTTSQFINTELYNQGLPKQSPVKQPFAADFQRPVVKPEKIFNFGQNHYNNFNTEEVKNIDQTPKFSTISSPFTTLLPTTPKPKKLKPHQPPLAVFLSQEAKRGQQVKVGDVLSYLKNANTVAVLDSVHPQSAPKVFIGPSTLHPPENFVKFELPYLSNIENSDKKLRQLPFFVAPLSYKTPEGFAKIPFPSPHVGSVVINADIKESISTTIQSVPSADIIPNSYSISPSYRQEQKITEKPNISFYSTSSPKTNAPSNYDSNYYSFEPQTVTSIRPPKEPEGSIATTQPKPDSFFLGNVGNDYNPSRHVSFPAYSNINSQEPVKGFNLAPLAPTTTTPKTTVTTRTTTTTKSPSTYPSQLLETHNPYSINQAFHFSTPLDYSNYFEDYKEGFVTPGVSQPLSTTNSPNIISPKVTSKITEILSEKDKYRVTTEKPKHPSSPNLKQRYTPEIHYESEISSSRYPTYNSNDYTRHAQKTDLTSENFKPHNLINSNGYYNEPSVNLGPPKEEIQPTKNLTETNEIPTTPDSDLQSTRVPYTYNQYDIITSNYNENRETTMTTTTTTRRPLTRQRGRPKYTTPRTDSYESTKTVVTRRPLRRPLPTRVKYEPNKISAERNTKKTIEITESTTKSSRTKTRGRIHYRPSGNDEYYDNKKKTQSSKENDLAYQRDVLHQNYPVTLMERMSTVDIEAFTEPVQKMSTNNLETISDTENAYTNERVSFSQDTGNTENKEEIVVQTEAAYIPSLFTNEENYQTKSSLIPIEGFSAYDDNSSGKDAYSDEAKPINGTHTSLSTTESNIFSNEQNLFNYSTENAPIRQDEAKQSTDKENKKSLNEQISSERENNVVQTTPSYNKVRVRPGVIRQFHQTSTESSRNKIERRKPVHAITYRPAFSARRTTMRIEEIEADLKTKQIHTRLEAEEHRHPVYKPEPTTESFVATTTQETLKRGQFRRRRPAYVTTTTEPTSTKKNTFEVKNRFRGRRPTTEKPTKPEIQTDTTFTIRNNPHSRYSRPRLSERYSKKPDVDEVEDQDSNYSINRPKLIAPEFEPWSPNISAESFKPYNPNEISDNKKTTTGKTSNTEITEPDIITARNEYEDILISVTPATNNQENKKIPDIPPTLEAFVEQSKVTKSDTTDTMSTFESMLEEVMKSLEEQDENEYTSTNVMKHKGGEIGEIPPERVITSGENYTQKLNILEQQETTTAHDSNLFKQDETKQKSNRRRGVWKKVKVRPITTESIETAESQFYTNTVNRLGQSIKENEFVKDKSGKYEKTKHVITTYKPNLQFLKDFFDTNDEQLDLMSTVEIPKINNINKSEDKYEHISTTTGVDQTTEFDLEKETPTEKSFQSPGDLDLGTGSPDPTMSDYFTVTETSFEKSTTLLDRSDSFSLMDYLFGVTSSDKKKHNSNHEILTKKEEFKRESDFINTTSNLDSDVLPEQLKAKLVTTESTFFPDEITTVSEEHKTLTPTLQTAEKIVQSTEKSVVRVETSTASSFMNPSNVVSTSMSTEISHETEICFRGKCIKTSKDIL